MTGSTQDEPGQEPLLDYGCTPWRISSQRAADLYDQGVRLWRREDLVNIEQQLKQSRTTEKFTVRRYDGSIVHIQNPMFGVQKPIWKPYVQFQEYWRLVRAKPDGPPETYLCTYLVGWINQTVYNYEGPFENAQLLFETGRKRWDESLACEAFRKLLLSKDGDAMTKVTKIVCFGLGDLNRKPPDWWRIENSSKPESERLPETSVVEGAITHHAIALTMADISRSGADAGGRAIRLLTQDPDYGDETKDMLRDIGFEVVGEYGAGGFAELVDESMVFSPFVSAPVKEIIADLARPAVIICAGSGSAGVFGEPKKPWADPEAPRTRHMWKGYETRDFPISSESTHLEHSLYQLQIHTRIGE